MSGDYIFLSYSHRDTERIQGIIDWLEANYHVWYDKNLGVAHEYNEEIADHIRNAKIVIAFFSEAYMKSPYCRDEIMYARTKGVEILGITIDQVRLSEGMQLRLGRFQMLDFSGGYDFEKIAMSEHIKPCKKSSHDGLLIDSLQQDNTALKRCQLPHLLFRTDFDSGKSFSECGQWQESKSGKLRVPVGLRQDVQTDEITEAYYDTAHGHQYVCGKTMSGKSTLLQTIVMQLMENYSPDSVQFYMIDFGNFMLELFKDAPHVGDIMDDSDMEKIKRFFLYMETVLRERIQFFRNGSYSIHAQKYGQTWPMILIVIDGFEIFCERYLAADENQGVFRALLRDGKRAGILFLLSRDNTRNLLYSLPMENIRPLTALGYETGEKYANVFSECAGTEDAGDRIKRENFELPGKGITRAGNKLYVFQAAIPNDIAEDYDRYDAIAEKCGEMQTAWQGQPAPAVPSIPGDFNFDYLWSMPEVAKLAAEKKRMPIGLNVYSALPASLTLTDNSVFTIAGRKTSGKSNLLRLLISQASLRKWSGIIIDPERTHGALAAKSGLLYAATAQELAQIIWVIARELKSRMEEMQRLQDLAPAEAEERFGQKFQPFFIFADDLKAFYRLLRESDAVNPRIGAVFYKMLEQGTRSGMYLVVTVDSEMSKRGYDEPVPGMTQMLQNNCFYGVFLGGDVFDNKWFEINYANSRQYKYDIEIAHGKGTALLIQKNSIITDVIRTPRYVELPDQA